MMFEPDAAGSGIELDACTTSVTVRRTGWSRDEHMSLTDIISSLS